ncbi:hypothetical protein C8A05DRAFT_34510 [Staphylotrichum tortipilum]|uniref:Uncharacterized protein n=1 Tax=Staphylotrichum tortipilum TaxID=2831512 RepID=A0AAN6MKD4_9PEZI|nr:hypothetical protein C8A05DRAFT_34510 [Staphylotrichum longicolle]
MEPITTAFDLSALHGKSALLTGGSSGLGLATALAWSAAGAHVTIADINPPPDFSLTTNLNYVHCDVTSWPSQIAAFKSALSFSPTRTLDIVATFAATAVAPLNEVDHVLKAGEPTLDVDPPSPPIKNFEVNLIGTYYTSWLALYYFRLPPTIPAPEGAVVDKSLIFVASIAAYMDSPRASTYPASKFGVRGLFRSTRARSREIGVRCNLLAPWFVDTPLVAPVKSALAARGVDMGRALGFVSAEACVEAAGYCAVGREVHGRAFAIQPEGTFDLKDDMEDGWAGDQLRPIIRRRREAGFDA